jgi:polyhydroxyalkanoate synthase
MASSPDTPVHGPEPLDLPLKLAIARLANGISPSSLAQAHADWLIHLAVSPSKQAQLASSALHKALQWSTFLARSLQGPCGECVQPQAGDRRFSDPAWHAQPYSALAQAFLLQEQWWHEAARGVRGVSGHHEAIADFTVRQWLDMLSPSNFPWSNPQVLRETAATGGGNLASGMANWWRDALAVWAGGQPRGVEAFRPGQAVAVTPGKVVMRNALAELIQYEPATPRVQREPVLIVPSWIMKFYILDLTPEDSLVRYLVDQGHTVFMVSWRNPGSEDAGLGLDDYLRLGVLDTLAEVHRRVPGAGIHAMGYCLGGTLLAMAAAVASRHARHPIRSVSILAGQVDFEEPGELGLFMDESQIAFLEDLMAERGYLDGRQMAGAFQLINSKDLVWSKLVHEYLMGAHTPMTALRAWNADATRLPARMHSEYLRKLYLNNDLAGGRYLFDGEPVDLGAIRVPVFVVATERDHVSPWRSVYKLLKLVHGPVEMVLSSGGHNVGIVNPPAGPQAHAAAGYRHAAHGPRKAPADPSQWLLEARQAQGSWWPEWERWLRRHSGTPVRARAVSGLVEGGQPVRAPGTYVFQT